jgi:hypothetical protein
MGTWIQRPYPGRHSLGKPLKGWKVGRSRRPSRSGVETRGSLCAHVQYGLEPQLTYYQYGRDGQNPTEESFYCVHNQIRFYLRERFTQWPTGTLGPHGGRLRGLGHAGRDGEIGHREILQRVISLGLVRFRLGPQLGRVLSFRSPARNQGEVRRCVHLVFSVQRDEGFVEFEDMSAR